jgi:prepilin-type processing-associated H-X9-DG protein
MSQAWRINSSVSLTILNTFICPSDGLSPISPQGSQWNGSTNNYLASVGATPGYLGGPTTGLFTQAFQAYGLQNITDGSSSTIAYGESLIGDGTIELVKWRDGPVTPTASVAGFIYDANSNYQAVLTDIGVCQAFFISNTNPTGSTGNSNQKGLRWGQDDGGFCLFNTIVPPSSSQYTFGACTMGKAASNTSDGIYQNTSSNHPGGANFLFGDGSVHFLKSSIGIRIYWALGTKADGEVISSDSY